MNVTSRPHQERFISREMRQKADRANKKETNYQGVEIPEKNVVRLHESFAEPGFPSAETLHLEIVEFFREHGKAPTELSVHFATRTSWVCLHVPELGLPWPVVSIRVRPGEFLELR